MSKGSVKLDEKTGLYYFVVDVGKDGIRKQKKKRGFKRQKDAYAAMTEVLNQVNKGEYIEPSKIKFIDYMLDIWIVEKEQNKHMSRLTAKSYRSGIVTHILPCLKDKTLGELTSTDIKGVMNCLKKKEKNGKPYADSYIQRIFNIMVYSLNYAVKNDLIKESPIKKLDRPKVIKRKLNVWDVDQIHRFLSSLENHRHYIVYFLAIHTGMRKGEILGLPWKNIDYRNKCIMVTQTLESDAKRIKEGAKTTSSVRSIDISDEVIEVLQRQYEKVCLEKELAGEMYEDNDLVCCTDIGKRVFPNTITRLMKKKIKELELPYIRFHDLRHTSASLMLSIGIHPKVVSERLGHHSVTITLDTYSHLLKNMQSDAAVGLSNLLSKKEEAKLLEIEEEFCDQKRDQKVENVAV
ncbi:site-specific integrase [Paenibacillus polymyxa]|uniref:site-specific integrase n=1 Tax=Paenibacillus polymyxa TaxID=1406 RepID=UPI000317EB6D|nr:site-specific integrase [Paenibacillus polymyxa]NMP11549.1 site-specific integrase [Paenibacillus polymyxa]